MTDNPFAALLDGVRRYPILGNGNVMYETAVLAALAAAVPDDLADAGKVADAADIYQFWVGDNLVNLGQTIRSLLASIAAQEAQIKGLEAEKRYWQGEIDTVLAGRADEHDRAEAAETALAAMTKERDELRACIAWVDEVYPERIEAGGAGIQITWEEFNAMQATIGVTVDKRIGGPEGKAVHNHRLRSALAAERAKTAKLVEAWDLARSHSLVKVTLGDGDARKSWGDFLIAMDEARAAITEAGQ